MDCECLPEWVVLLRGFLRGVLLFMFYKKLVDCLEKCLICRHIRRFAD